MRNTFSIGCLVLLLAVVSRDCVAQANEQESAKPATSAKVATLTVKGSLPETAGQLGLFGQLEQNLPDLVARLDRAAADKEVSAVVLRLRNPSIGRGKLQELREAILRVRQGGKKVIAELQVATSADYVLACACDEIVMPESGSLIIPGVRAEVTFFKGLFDKLGIEADMMQVGDFKGAAEPYTRKEMSPQFREQYELVLDDYYAQLIETVAEGRKLDAAKVRELIDIGMFLPAEAQKVNLIDTVAYEDELQGRLKESLGVDTLVLVKDYGKKKVDSDFSGMLGMIRLFELMAGVEPSKRGSKNKQIAVVYASGLIMPGKSTASLFGGEITGSDTIVKALREAGDDKNVVAIVLRVDSPGGSALASDLIWRATRKIEKPVVASMGDVAGSGGYYISMGCDQVYAGPGTLTGSIGVVGGKLALKGLYDKIGLTTDVISRGKNSGLLSSDSPFTESERARWKETIEEVYRQFLAKAAEGRKMDLDKLEPLAGGRIWTGRQAKGNGLVDEVGTLQDAIAAAKKLAGLEADEKAELLILPRPTSIFEQIFGGDMALQSGVNHVAEGVPLRLSRRIAEIGMLEKLFSEPALYVMPYRVEIR